MEEHKGLIIYHICREWPDSPLDSNDIRSIAYETFMECWEKWDGERPFGKFFGTFLTYNIRAARLTSPFTVSSRTIHRGSYIPTVVEGDALVFDKDYSILSNVGDGRGEPFRDAARVVSAVASLPRGQRRVMELTLMDYTQAEIGRILDVSREAVRQMYNKGIKSLQGEFIGN